MIASPGPASGNEFTGETVSRPTRPGSPSDNLRAMSTAATSLWICESCGWIYDPAEGDPDGGIPAGTAFEDIPDDWFCPVCGARKADFEPYEA